jgi:hypothetical protein
LHHEALAKQSPPNQALPGCLKANARKMSCICSGLQECRSQRGLSMLSDGVREGRRSIGSGASAGRTGMLNGAFREGEWVEQRSVTFELAVTPLGL